MTRAANICFFYEDNDVDVWSGRHTDLDAWNYAARAAGSIDRIVVVNRTSEVLTPGGSFEVVEDYPVMEGLVAKFVGPGEGGTPVSLWSFMHEVDWYAFGPASGWSSELVADLDVVVPQSGMAALHSVHIASLVLLHRYHVIGG